MYSNLKQATHEHVALVTTLVLIPDLYNDTSLSTVHTSAYNGKAHAYATQRQESRPTHE